MTCECDEAEVVRIARAHLRREARLEASEGALVVEAETNQVVRWQFVSRRGACSAEEPTRIDCRFHPPARVMWIGEVHVAPELRGRGLGKRLVAAAEAVAADLAARTVYVFPLAPARAFWQRLGYRPHRRMARVMVKDLACGSPRGQ